MKKTILKVCIFVVLCISLTSCYNDMALSAPQMKQSNYKRALEVTSIGDLKEEVRGTWIASVYNINFPSAPDLPEEKLKDEINTIIDGCRRIGLNTLFFQVHPCSDALYKSEQFPVSRYLSSTGKLYFDPLQYMIEECRKNNISLYGWINPLRVTVASFNNKAAALASLDETNGPSTTPELLVYYNDGKLYYDPGIPKVADIVSDCIKEIISQYDLDGIVFDDYFYPYPTGTEPFDDSVSYEQYSAGQSLGDWRRNNINTIIQKCFDTIKEYDPSIRFGVAPFGIWKNGDGGSSGSLTSGLESYSAIYCDPLTWAREGYVDFLSPQLYWSSDSTAASYTELYKWWSTSLDGTGVDYIPSLGAYNYEEGWDEPTGIISEQVSLARQAVSFRGELYYGLGQLLKNTNGISDEIELLNKSLYYYYDYPSLPRDLIVDTPITGMVFENETVSISGVSDLRSPLLINGEKAARDRDGSFKTDVSLIKGENEIIITCGDQTIELKLYYK